MKTTLPDRKGLCGVVFALVLALAGGLAPAGRDALASTQSEILRSKGMLHLLEQAYPDAVEVLSRAVESDPNDRLAAYYLAVATSRNGDYANAIQRLEGLREQLPKLKDGLFELGFAYYRNDQFEAATNAFRASLEVDPTLLKTRYYLALVLVEQERFAAAREELAQVLAAGDSEFREQALFLDVVATYRLGEVDNVEQQAHRLLQSYPQSLYAARVNDIVDRARALREGYAPKYSVTVALAYDDNVGLYSNQDPLAPAGNTGDTRLQLGANASRTFWTLPGIGDVNLGYRLFASHHSSLNRFDLLSHQPYVELHHSRGKLDLLVNYSYSATALDGSDYLRTHQLMPVAYFGHDGGRTSMVALALLRQDFRDDATYRARDAWQWNAQYRHIWNRTNNAFFYAGGELLHDQTKGIEFKSTAVGLTGGVQWPVERYLLAAEGSYLSRDYPSSTIGRSDKILGVNLLGEYPIRKDQSLTISVNWVKNSSTDNLYNYVRSILTIGYGRNW